ncbi:MAG TPA: hypothetical protein VHY10_06720 [Xanthobacteraceae bacterium]|jgi:hypothetical protein|nr:hypothetical protein [Xanthobacteraceae bacterium]
MATETQNSTTTLHLVLAWGWVGIPLAWGVWETVLNAMKLFQ